MCMSLPFSMRMTSDSWLSKGKGRKLTMTNQESATRNVQADTIHTLNMSEQAPEPDDETTFSECAERQILERLKSHLESASRDIAHICEEYTRLDQVPVDPHTWDKLFLTMEDRRRLKPRDVIFLQILLWKVQENALFQLITGTAEEWVRRFRLEIVFLRTNPDAKGQEKVKFHLCVTKADFSEAKELKWKSDVAFLLWVDVEQIDIENVEFGSSAWVTVAMPGVLSEALQKKCQDHSFQNDLAALLVDRVSFMTSSGEQTIHINAAMDTSDQEECNYSEKVCGAMEISHDSESGDGRSSLSGDSDLETVNWKEEALGHLLFIFHAALRKLSKSDLPPLTPAIREVISRALVGVEERVLRYAEHVTRADNPKRGGEETKFLLEMEQSVKSYFEERLSTRAASHNYEVEPPPTEYDGEDTDLHVRALTRCHSFLMEEMTVWGAGLVDHMVQRKLVSVASREALMEKASERERSREVLRVAAGLTRQQFTASFLPALREGDNGHLADKLESTMEELRESPRSDSGRWCRVCPLRARVDLGSLADPLLGKGLIPRDFHDDLCKGTMPSTEAWKQLFRHVGHTQKLLPILGENYPGVVEEMEKRGISSLECPCLMPADFLAPIPPPDFSEDASDVSRLSDVASTLYPKKTAVPEYPMTSGKRGICWVVENSVFIETKSKQKHTKNFDGSTNLIQEEFQRLGFQMVRHSNLTAPQLMKEARRMAALDHSQHDCFVCVVRSRGEACDAILCSDCTAVLVQDLMEVFNASRCPSLVGKPKVFYMLMSRGDKDEGGVAVPREKGRELHPYSADFLLIQTALPGIRQSAHPTTCVPRHLQLLAGVLQRHAHTQDFLSCLAMANSHYGSQITMSGTFFTAPVTSTLRKALIFRQLR